LVAKNSIESVLGVAEEWVIPKERTGEEVRQMEELDR